jgi:lipopolysaccharide cholinephosphotransferase
MDEKKYYTDTGLIKKLYRLAYLFHNIMVKHSILYYASGGTLLGSIRHKGIIPWDNDLDFCIPLVDKCRFLSKEVIKEFSKSGYKVDEGKNGWYRILGKKGKDSADIFFVEMTKRGDEWIIQHTDKALKFWPNDYIKYKDLFPLKERPFGSGFILTPNRPKPSLTSLYGKSWKNVGYITIDPEEHLELDEPIKLKVKIFNAAKPFYDRKQIHMEKDDPYLRGVTM